MHSRAWTFSLDGEEHRVVMDYSVFTAWERLTLDGKVLAEGHRWTFISRYDFSIGDHPVRVTFNSPMYELSVTVDGTPCELLPSNTLLRPAVDDEELLLRPSDGAAEADTSRLLHPSDPPSV